MKANLLCLGAAQSHKVISRNTPKKEAAAKEEGKKIEIRGNKTKKKRWTLLWEIELMFQ